MLGCAAVAAVGSNARESAVAVPSGLSPGDTYRIVFVTSATTEATYRDINYYNNFVASAANCDPALATLNTTWTALVSTDTVNALSNSGLSANDTTTRFFNTQGDPIAEGVTVRV